MSGAELEIEDGALRAIAAYALARGTGARGLRATMETVLLDAMFDLPHPAAGQRVRVDAALVAARLGAAGAFGEGMARAAAMPRPPAAQKIAPMTRPNQPFSGSPLPGVPVSSA
jgi:hypothetical protein